MNKRVVLQNIMCTRLTREQLSIIKRDWNFFYTDPYRYMGSNIVKSVHKHLGTSECEWWTNEYGWKLSQLEGVLKAELTKENVEHIKVFWRAFYESPEDFQNDKVIELICQDLGLEYNDKELYGMKSIFKEMPRITNLHHSVTGDVVWGKCNGIHFYAKKLTNDISISRVANFTLDELKGKWSKPSLFVLYYKDDSSCDSVHIVFNSEDLSGHDGITEFDFELSGYTYKGMYVINDKYAHQMLKHIANIYIPFAKGANDSRIPIVWLNTTDTTSLSLSTNYECDLDVDWFTEGFNKDQFYKFCQSVTEVLPSVDLEDRPNDRYATIELINLYSTIAVYNRNHKAYHGNVTRLREFAPILLMSMAICKNSKSLEACNIMEVLLDESLDESAFNIDTVKEETKVVAEEKPQDKNVKTVKEDNILMRAAMASDTSVKVTN